MELLKIKVIDHIVHYAYDGESENWELVDERYLRKHGDKHYDDLNENGRAKAFARFLKSAESVKEIEVDDLPTCPRKIRRADGERCRPDDTDIASGVNALFTIRDLFPEKHTGLTILANFLAGAHAEALYTNVGIPGFHFDLAVNDASPELIDVLSSLDRAALPCRKKERSKVRVKLNPVLDFRDGKTRRDFCEVRIKVKGHGKVKTDAEYLDRALMFIGATAEQITSLEQATARSSRLLVNSTLPKSCHATRIKPAAVSLVDDAVLAAIAENRGAVAAAYSFYRCGVHHERRWAAGIVSAAKARIGVTEGRFRSVSYDHRELAQAIRCELLLDYIELNADAGFLDEREAEQLRNEINEVFHPAPPEKPAAAALRRMEDGEVFIEIMRILADQFHDRIIPDGEPFVKPSGKNKTFACWRTISGERFLCVPEDTWKTEYLRACKAADIDTTYTEQRNWSQKLQKQLSLAGLIRYEGGGNYRHRLDLYGTGKKNEHVILIPEQKLGGSPNE